MLDTSLSLLEHLRDEPDADSWQRLVDLYTPLLQSWLRRYEELSAADVEDLVQNVLLTVSQDLQKFHHNQQDGAFRKWLKTILIHRLRDHWRSQSHRPIPVGGSDFLEQIEQLEDHDSGISRLWDQEHDRHVLGHLLTLARPHFSVRTWEAFRLQTVGEASARSVAKDLQMDIGAVYAAKSRVLAVLRKMADGLMESDSHHIY